MKTVREYFHLYVCDTDNLI